MLRDRFRYFDVCVLLYETRVKSKTKCAMPYSSTLGEKYNLTRNAEGDVRGRGAQSEHVYNRGVHRFCRRLGQPASLSPAPYSTQPLQSVGSGWSSSGLLVFVLVLY